MFTIKPVQSALGEEDFLFKHLPFSFSICQGDPAADPEAEIPAESFPSGVPPKWLVKDVGPATTEQLRSDWASAGWMKTPRKGGVSVATSESFD